MNFRERATVDVMDVLNESDESDQEYMAFSSRLLVGDIDIATVYRKLCSNNWFNNNPNQRHQKSVAVQTDSDISNIPPSWLLETEQLVCELYTGLGNIINSIYYNPQSYNKHDAMKRAKLNPSEMKYFTFENGYWQSTLLPGIKIPDLMENKQNRSLFSEDIKRKLFHLLDVATKLRNVSPDASHLASCENQVADDKIPQCFNSSLKVEPSGELGRNQSQGEHVKISDRNIPDIDLINDLEENGSNSGESSVCSSDSDVWDVNNKESITKRVRIDSVHEVMKKQHVVLDGCGSDEIPGVKVLRYALATRVATNAQNSREVHKLRMEDIDAENSKLNFASEKTMYATVRPDTKVLPSCSNIKQACKIQQCGGARDVTSSSKLEKLTSYGQENCNEIKSKRGNREKDFIRKNILDIKNKYNQSTSVTGRNSNIINTKLQGTVQNGRHKISPPLREEMRL